MKAAALITSAFIITGCAHDDPWTKQDTAMFSAMAVAMAADAYSTSNIQYHPLYEEGGMIAREICGPNPSTSCIWQYTGALLVSHYFISRALPSNWRPYYIGLQTGVHGVAAIRNGKEGLFDRCEELPITPIVLVRPRICK